MEGNKPPVPVADVTPPKAPPSRPPAPHAPGAVHEAPSPEKTGEDAKPPASAAPAKPAAHKDKPSHEEPEAPRKEENPGAGMAIAATVVIVLGLAAMATFAYLKTQ